MRTVHVLTDNLLNIVGDDVELDLIETSHELSRTSTNRHDFANITLDTKTPVLHGGVNKEMNGVVNTLAVGVVDEV